MNDNTTENLNNLIESENDKLIRLAKLSDNTSDDVVIVNTDLKKDIKKYDPDEKISNELCLINNSCIKRYANLVGRKFCVPSELRLFAAYFFKIGPGEKYSAFDEKNYPVLKIMPDFSMSGYDLLESLRIVFNNPKNRTIKAVTGKTISELCTEDQISIDTKLFPEYGLLKNHFDQYINYTAHTNQLLELLKIPQMGRTFYAGAIVDWLAANTFFENPKRKKIVVGCEEAQIELSSKYIADYAEKYGISDYGKYLKMLQIKA